MADKKSTGIKKPKEEVKEPVSKAGFNKKTVDEVALTVSSMMSLSR